MGKAPPKNNGKYVASNGVSNNKNQSNTNQSNNHQSNNNQSNNDDSTGTRRDSQFLNEQFSPEDFVDTTNHAGEYIDYEDLLVGLGNTPCGNTPSVNHNEQNKPNTDEQNDTFFRTNSNTSSMQSGMQSGMMSKTTTNSSNSEAVATTDGPITPSDISPIDTEEK
jgi:hypothetical protein